ncbi:MAG TPA: hypothetical protein VGB98_10865 [Pyrinomonadaceae bacterium]|jgi:hypothetical protein
MATGGKKGKAPADFAILQLADRYGIDPYVIEHEWSERSVNRMLMYIEAGDLARSGKVG